MDEDLNQMSREQLVAEVKRLRGGIRGHRDSSGQDLCWHHPALWGLLPEKIRPAAAGAVMAGIHGGLRAISAVAGR